MNAITPIGSGGGPSAPPRPSEAPNTLRAKQTLRLLYLVSEGTCLGLIDGGKSIFIGDTPLVAADGTANFQGVRWEVRDGSPGQEPISGIPLNVSALTSVGQKVTVSGGPVVRVVDCTGADRLKLTVQVPALFRVDQGTGDQSGAMVEFAFEWRVAGTSGAWLLLAQATIEGKCVAPYARQISVAVPSAGQIELRMRRLSGDSTSQYHQTDIYWQSFATVVDRKLSYPGSAMVALEVDAEQFGSSTDNVTFDWGGLFCSVPVNYDPETATYTGGAGSWNGVFKKAYTSNPAWILYTLLTDPDWGCGALMTGTSVAGSKWLFHSIAQYCDELVPDGFGGQERRYTFNTWINTRDEAMRVATAIATAFRGMLYWGAGVVVPVADQPRPVVKDVNPTNVLDGIFEYEGSSFRARHSVVKVRWRDPALGHRETIEVVEDPDLVAIIGVRETEYEAFGCTSRSLARRLGRWVLYTEKHETTLVRYRASLDHAGLRPGEVVAIQDPSLAGAAFSGRLLAVDSATAVTLDREVELSAGQTYQLRVALPQGGLSSLIPISNTLPATTRTLTLGSAMPAMPEPGAVWTIVASNLAPTTFAVLAVEEEAPMVYAVTALQHHAAKYGFVDQGLALTDEPYTIFRDYGAGLAPPSNPTAVEWITGTGATTLCRVDFSWTAPVNDPRVTGFEAQALSGGVLKQALASRSATVTFLDLTPGPYTFQVRAVGAGGLVSAWVATDEMVVDGLADPPAGPAGLAALGGVRTIAMRWNASADRLYRDTEVWASSTSTFSAGAIVGRTSGREFIHTGLSPNVTRHYWVRHVNTLGQTSAWVGPVSATTSLLIAADIQDGIVSTAKFASSIAPVGLVTSVPTSKGTNPDVIFNQTDGQLYRWNGSSYVRSVPAADIVGELTDSQIASLAAAKLTGQITQTQITDGAISTPKLAAGAVDANKIAAGAITTEKLSVGSANVLWNSCLTLDTAGWSISASMAPGRNPSLSAAKQTFPAWVPQDVGGGAIEITVPAGATVATSEFASAEWERVSVLPSTRYHFSALVGPHRIRARVQINWFDGADSYITSTFGNEVTGPSGGLWDDQFGRSSIITTSPANARFARLVIVGIGTGTPNAFANSYVFFTKAMFGQAPSNATEAPVWSPGGVTEISGGMVRARTLAADRLMANSITAGELAANSVVAGKIAAGAVSADQIAAGEIRAVHMASETIITQAAQLGTAVVGQAQIASAAITNAKIGNLEVDTLKIANGAISGFIGASAAVNASVNRNPGVSYVHASTVGISVSLAGDGRAMIITRNFGVKISGAPAVGGDGPGDGGSGE